MCIATLAPPTTATETFNVAIIARWGGCQLRGDAGCPIAESPLSILDDEVLSQNAWPTNVASLSLRGIYTWELVISLGGEFWRKNNRCICPLDVKSLTACLLHPACLLHHAMKIYSASPEKTLIRCLTQICVWSDPLGFFCFLRIGGQKSGSVINAK